MRQGAGRRLAPGYHPKVASLLDGSAQIVYPEGLSRIGRYRFAHMWTLALDTCEARGSIGLRQAGKPGLVAVHAEGEYSGWLLPAVDGLLAEAGIALAQLDLIAVATGPGSFTGVRVGLTVAKAWADVYGLKLVGVSRLEAMATAAPGPGIVASLYDAQRNQIFAGLYRKDRESLEGVGPEMVASPEEFLGKVEQAAEGEHVPWVTPDPHFLLELPDWERRVKAGDTLIEPPTALTGLVGALAEARARLGEYTDPLTLDANYVRRSDAEIFWKGPASRAR